MPLPILISIPHGGMDIPDELKDRLVLSTTDIHDDIDPFTQEIYDPGDEVVSVIKTDIARTFVDMSRAEDDLPPENPDGVIKSMTCNGVQVYKEGFQPDAALRETLIDRYHRSYHKRLQATLRDDETEMMLDCHSMQAVGPVIAPDSGKKRPIICLGNRHHQTCPVSTITHLAQCMRKAFDLRKSDVLINQPFAGGYITRTYGNNPVPCIQIELNRCLYLDPAWYDRESLTVDADRLTTLRQQFTHALHLFWGE